MSPIDKDCDCSTCKTYTRSYLHHIATIEPVCCSILSVHNIAYQLRLMKDIRNSITEDVFPEFVKEFMSVQFSNGEVPKWIKDALTAVNINL